MSLSLREAREPGPGNVNGPRETRRRLLPRGGPCGAKQSEGLTSAFSVALATLVHPVVGVSEISKKNAETRTPFGGSLHTTPDSPELPRACSSEALPRACDADRGTAGCGRFCSKPVESCNAGAHRALPWPAQGPRDEPQGSRGHRPWAGCCAVRIGGRRAVSRQRLRACACVCARGCEHDA